MFSTCFNCDANALLSVMFVCGNSACGRLFCQKCAKGFLKTSCPRCGHAGTLKPPDELRRAYDAITQPTAPSAPRQAPSSSGWLQETRPPNAKAASGQSRAEKSRAAAAERYRNAADQSRKESSSVLERLLHVLNSGGFESKGGWFSGPKTLAFTADTPIDEICDDDVGILLHDLQDEFNEIPSGFWGDSPAFMARQTAWIYFGSHKKSARAFSELISQQLPSRPETSSSQATSAQTIPFGTCLHLAAVIAAVDGKIESEEVGEIISTLEQMGMPEDQLKERFITICRRVHSEGLELWAQKLCASLNDSQQQQASNGLKADQVLKLLKRVGKNGSGDLNEKKRLFNRFKAAMGN